MVEQGTHKPLVGGSNPPSATRTICGPMPSVGYSPQRHFDFLKEMTAVGRRTLDQTSAAISTSSRR